MKELSKNNFLINIICCFNNCFSLFCIIEMLMEWQFSIYIYNLFYKINVIFFVLYFEIVENRNKNMDICLLKFNS